MYSCRRAAASARSMHSQPLLAPTREVLRKCSDHEDGATIISHVPSSCGPPGRLLAHLHLSWAAALRRRRAHMEAASLHSRREIAASYSTRSPLGTPGHGYFATWRAIPETSIVSIHGLVAASGGRFRDRERAPRTGIPRVVLEARDSHPTPFSRKREKSRLDFSLFAALTGSDSAARLVARPTADPS